MWFRGFDSDGGNSWATEDDQTGGDANVYMRFNPAQIEVGGQTKLIIESLDLGLVGKTVTITPDDPTKASYSALTAVFEKDAYGKASAVIDVIALAEGTSIPDYAVNA